MALRRAFLLVMLVGLLLLAGAAAAERIQRSTDQQGTIHIGNTGPASEEKASDLRAPSGPVASEQEPPGLTRPSARRPYGPEAEARRKAFWEAHPSPPPPPEAPAPAAPPAQPEPPPPPEPPYKE